MNSAERVSFTARFYETPDAHVRIRYNKREWSSEEKRRLELLVYARESAIFPSM